MADEDLWGMDPFGGTGVKLPGGGWLPGGHPQTTTPPPPTAPTPAPAPADAWGPDPFGGSGVRLPGGGWAPAGHPDAGGQPPGSGPGGTTPPPGGTGNPPPSTTPSNYTLQGSAVVGNQLPQGSSATVTGAFQQALLNRLAPGPISAESPEIAGALAANRASEQRGFERDRAQLAERAAAQGLDQNAFNTNLQGLSSERSLREGQFAGGLTWDLAKQRSQEITAALALGGSMLSDQDRMTLQRQLAELQAQVQREGLAQEKELGLSDLDLRKLLGLGDLDVRRDLGFGNIDLGYYNADMDYDKFLKDLGFRNKVALDDAFQ